MPPSTLICTVGTSLISNIRKAELKDPEDLRAALDREEWPRVALLLKELDPGERLCGAEINSVHDMLQRGMLEDPPAALHLCVSETGDGHAVGELLRYYYRERVPRTEVHPIEGLRDDQPGTFRTVGLRSLAREIGRIVRDAGAPRYVAINATGGFKAQIAIAVLTGQALGVEVFYKFERFSEIISFPPMPIAFDYELVGRNAALLDHLESDPLLGCAVDEVDERLRTLLEGVELDGRTCWTLAPIGQIYLEGYRLRYPAEATLPPPAIDRSRRPTFGNDHHFPDGFKEFVEKIYRETAYVVTCHSLPNAGQAGIRDRTFDVRGDEVVGEYRDRTGFGARFSIHTTANSPLQRTAAAMDLNARYGR